MSSSHYVVSERSESVWQFSHKGEIAGPYASREAAVEAAISEAKASLDADCEVLVRDASLKTVTVWNRDRRHRAEISAHLSLNPLPGRRWGNSGALLDVPAGTLWL